jgi:Beta-lactamase enzyme family
MQKQKGLSFFVVRTMAISFLVVVGSLTFLPSGQAHAQRRRVASSGIVMNTVVYDVSDNHYYTYNASTLFVAGSSMKVPIMLTFFDMIEREGREPTRHEYGLLRTMIENSNNDSASALYYGEIGGAAGVASYMRRIGISGLYPNPDAWGWSLIYPSTMVHLLTRLYEGTILTAYHRSLAFYYMEHVEADQRVGVGDTAPEGATVALKDGWVVAPDGLWAMNSSGIVMLGQETYVIAAYTREDPSLLAGHNALRLICARVASELD